MSIKVFKTNKAGKIEFTRCELEKLLNETYNEGYHDGENHAKSDYWTWTSPTIVTTPYYRDSITSDSTAMASSNAIKVGICAGVGKVPETPTKVLEKEAPSRTYEAKGMTYNMDDVVKTVDALLSDKSIFNTGPYTPSVNGAKKVTENNSVANLAKELRGL